MPIYEYRRPDGTTFEVQQSFSDEPLTHDPETGVPVARVFHPPAVHFKGKGFYNTDYGTRARQRETAAAAAVEKGDGGEKSSGSAEKDKAGSGTAEAGSGKGEAGSGAGQAAKPSSNGKAATKPTDKPVAAS
jgi:putative FmdB family regulatory protein